MQSIGHPTSYVHVLVDVHWIIIFLWLKIHLNQMGPCVIKINNKKAEAQTENLIFF